MKKAKLIVGSVIACFTIAGVVLVGMLLVGYFIHDVHEPVLYGPMYMERMDLNMDGGLDDTDLEIIEADCINYNKRSDFNNERNRGRS